MFKIFYLINFCTKIYIFMHLLKVYVKKNLHYSNFIICFVFVSICRIGKFRKGQTIRTGKFNGSNNFKKLLLHDR